MDVEDLEVYRRPIRCRSRSTAPVSGSRRSSSGPWRTAPPGEQVDLREPGRRLRPARHAPADFRRFVVMGIGSADEMRVWLRYARDLGYVEPAQVAAWSAAYAEIARMLQGLLRGPRPRP